MSDELAAPSDQTTAADELARLLARIESDLTPSQRRAAAALRRTLMLPEAVYLERDQLVRQLRHRFYADRSDHDASHQLAADWRRYASSAWRFERSAESCPVRHSGSVREVFWQIMQILPRPLSPERVRKILGREPPLR